MGASLLALAKSIYYSYPLPLSGFFAKNPNWQEANQLAIVQAWPRISLNAELPKTNPGSGQGGT